MISTPLLTLFTRLQKAGFPLAIDNYVELLNLIEAGWGVESREKLAQLCSLLWVKSRADEHLFREYFDELFPVEEIIKPKPQPRNVSTSFKQPTPTDIEEPIPQEEESKPEPFQPEDKPEETSEELVITAVAIPGKPEFVHRKAYFPQSQDYVPASLKQMQQSWQKIEPFSPVQDVTDIDIEATITSIQEKGMYFDLVFGPLNLQKPDLLLLLDWDGSMMPFHSLLRQLRQSLSQSGQFNQIRCYYFHNVPVSRLFLDAEREKSETLAQVVSQLNPPQTIILMVSDGGAAKGSWNYERLFSTRQFLRRFQRESRAILWLNPMPKNRWTETTAEDIAKTVLMFDCSSQGLQNACQVGILHQ